jgi:predicted permease
MALVQVLGLVWLIIAIAYCLMWQDNQTLNKMRFGMSTIVIISLPVLLFESLYTVNLRSVNYGVILSVFFAKGALFCVGSLVGLATSNGNLAVGGLYAMFLTLGNDIAIGVPIMKNLYPELVPYDLFLCCISELIFNPIAYFMFEISNHKKAGEKIQLCKIFAHVIAEPMVVFALFGLICNLIFNVGLGHCKLEDKTCELPAFLELVYRNLGGAFNLVALLSAGLNIYGKEKALTGKRLLMPLGLCCLRIFLLPIITLVIMQKILLGSLSLPNAESFAFLYVLIPAGPGTLVMVSNCIVRHTLQPFIGTPIRKIVSPVHCEASPSFSAL